MVSGVKEVVYMQEEQGPHQRLGRLRAARGPWLSCVVGEGCVVGHKVILHGCQICDGCLVGMNALVLNGAKIGGAMVAAGAV